MAAVVDDSIAGGANLVLDFGPVARLLLSYLRLGMAIGKQFYKVEVRHLLKHFDWCGNYYLHSEAKFHQENCRPKLREQTERRSPLTTGRKELRVDGTVAGRHPLKPEKRLNWTLQGMGYDLVARVTENDDGGRNRFRTPRSDPFPKVILALRPPFQRSIGS